MLQINSKKYKNIFFQLEKLQQKQSKQKNENRHKEKFGWMPKLYNFSFRTNILINLNESKIKVFFVKR